MLGITMSPELFIKMIPVIFNLNKPLDMGRAKTSDGMVLGFSLLFKEYFLWKYMDKENIQWEKHRLEDLRTIMSDCKIVSIETGRITNLEKYTNLFKDS